MSDTPLCDALARDALDSNDMSAWHSLAYRLEKELARLRVVRPEAELIKDAARWRAHVRLIRRQHSPQMVDDLIAVVDRAVGEPTPQESSP